MSGKGSAPRPFSVDAETYAANFDAIFYRKDAGAKDGPTIPFESPEGGFDKESKEIKDGSRREA